MKMNKKIRVLFLLMLTLSALGWQSCQYNACKSRAVECQNGGVCDLGECTCVDGYEGEFCEDPVNEKFVSHYSMVRTELINSSPPQFDDDDTLVVSADKVDRNLVYFFSPRDSATIIEGRVRENAMTISEQTVQGFSYRGEGSLNGDKLTITLSRKNNLNASTSDITYVGKKYETF
jgi:hypothetical protein